MDLSAPFPEISAWRASKAAKQIAEEFKRQHIAEEVERQKDAAQREREQNIELLKLLVQLQQMSLDAETKARVERLLTEELAKLDKGRPAPLPAHAPPLPFDGSVRES
jgi:hypothetical protein